MEMNEARKLILDFTRTKSYEALSLWLSEEMDKVHSQMEVVKEPIELGKLQGRIKILRQMLQLEKEVSNL